MEHEEYPFCDSSAAMWKGLAELLFAELPADTQAVLIALYPALKIFSR